MRSIALLGARGEPTTFLRRNRWSARLLGIVQGFSLCIFPAFLLILSYGLCLTEPSSPDYYTAKLWMMFWNTELAFFTWPSAGVLLFGLFVAVVRRIRPFLDGPPTGLSANWRDDILSARETSPATGVRKPDDGNTRERHFYR